MGFILYGIGWLAIFLGSFVVYVQADAAVRTMLAAPLSGAFPQAFAAIILIAELAKLGLGHRAMQSRSGWLAFWYVVAALVTLSATVIGNLAHDTARAGADRAKLELYREQEAKRADLKRQIATIDTQIGAGTRLWKDIDADYRRIANKRLTCSVRDRDALCDQMDRLADEGRRAKVVEDARANREKLTAALGELPPFDAELDLQMRLTRSISTSEGLNFIEVHLTRIAFVAVEVAILLSLLLISWAFHAGAQERAAERLKNGAATPTKLGGATTKGVKTGLTSANSPTNLVGINPRQPGVTVRAWLLSELQLKGEVVGSQAQLAAAAGCSAASISSVLHRLVAEGVMRKEHGAGGAAKWVKIQPKSLLVVVK